MNKSKLHVGDTVMSHYRAHWYGVILNIVELRGGSLCARVQITHDRHGRPIRKPGKARNRTVISLAWLTKEEAQT